MLRATLKAQEETIPATTLSETLLDGGTYYGVSGFEWGRLFYPYYGDSSQGLVAPYGQGAPAWGGWEMFTDGVIGQSYDEQWDLTGAGQPTTYEILTGALPDGLSLDSPSGNLGTITGTPTTAGTFNFTLRATNEFGSADKAFTITIVAPPAGGGGAWAFVA